MKTHKLRLPAILLLAVSPVLCMNTQAETVSEIFALASENDAQLKGERYSWLANRETEALSRASLLPQVSLGANYSRSDYNSSATDTESEQYSISVSQSLFNLSNWYTYQQGKQLVSQADASFRKSEQDLIVRVAKAYTAALAALDAYETAKAEEAAIGRQLEQTKQRFEVGLIAITDVHESQASFDSAVVKRVNALGEIGIAFEALEVLTGQAIQGINPLVDDFPVSLPDTPRDEWVRLALANNPDLSASRYAVEAAAANAKSKASMYMPTVSGQLQYNDQDTNQSPGFDFDQHGAVFTLSVNVPLYSGGGINAGKRQAYYQLNAAREAQTRIERNTVQAARSQ
ncbi:MAG: TolC family outer membrane protein, partial [Pseudomonadales bacterium]|nr:TolC family outer membrane protein [Pseudomonadales bacterium]